MALPVVIFYFLQPWSKTTSATCCPFKFLGKHQVTTTNSVVACCCSSSFPKERTMISNHVVRHLFLFLFIDVKEDNELHLSSSPSSETSFRKRQWVVLLFVIVLVLFQKWKNNDKQPCYLLSSFFIKKL